MYMFNVRIISRELTREPQDHHLEDPFLGNANSGNERDEERGQGNEHENGLSEKKQIIPEKEEEEDNSLFMHLYTIHSSSSSSDSLSKGITCNSCLLYEANEGRRTRG